MSCDTTLHLLLPYRLASTPPVFLKLHFFDLRKSFGIMTTAAENVLNPHIGSKRTLNE